MKARIIIGKVIGREKNCACGKTHEGWCNKCDSDALDVIAIKEIVDDYEVEEEDYLDAHK